MRFHATVELGGKTATGVEVPRDVVESLGPSKRPAVRVTINDYTYRSSVAPMGGRFLLGISAEVRAAAGVQAGDEVDIDIELDTEPREVAVPPDFTDALAGDPAAKTFFHGLSLQQPAAGRALDRGSQDGRDPPATDRQGGQDAECWPNIS